MSYPIHITNIYELLNEDGEPTSVKVNASSSANSKDTKQTAQRTTTNVGANQQKTTGQTSTKGAPTKTGNQSSRGSGERGPLGERKNTDRQSNDRVGRPQGERPPRQQGDRPPRQQNFSTQGSEDVESRNRGGFGGASERRDTGESRGERRARGAPAGGFVGNRRVFDRKSGTGRGRDQKKGGAGRGNWGKEGDASVDQVIAEDVAAVEEGKEDQVKEDKPEEPEKEKVETEEEKQEREEREKEEKTMTLQDYLKQRESKGPVVALPTERKANEGVDQNEAKKWNNYQEIKRDDQETDASTGAKDKKKKEKNLVPTFFTVKDTTQPRRERDDSRRGGDRRRGGSNGGRGGRGGSSRGGRGSKGGDAPHFDENSFPKL